MSDLIRIFTERGDLAHLDCIDTLFADQATRGCQYFLDPPAAALLFWGPS